MEYYYLLIFFTIIFLLTFKKIKEVTKLYYVLNKQKQDKRIKREITTNSFLITSAFSAILSILIYIIIGTILKLIY